MRLLAHLASGQVANGQAVNIQARENASIQVVQEQATTSNAGLLRIAAVKYSGGGDWYQASTPLPNFLRYVRSNTLMQVDTRPDVVELSSDKVFGFPVPVPVWPWEHRAGGRRSSNGSGGICKTEDFCMWTTTTAWTNTSGGK